MTRRNILEAALARAEDDLRRAVSLHAAADDRFTAGDALAKARATCRSAHAALMDLDIVEG